MKTIKRLSTVLCLAALLLAPLAGQAVGEASKDTLVYALYGDIKDWDPAIAFSLIAPLPRTVEKDS